MTHLEPSHRCPSPQPRPQAPQFVSVVVGVSQPLDGSASQLPKPPRHPTSAQTPAAHVVEAFARSHVARHAPQSVGLVRVSTSQPLAALPSQLATPIPAQQIPPLHV